MKTAIMANRVDSPASCTFLRSNDCSKHCFIRRFSQWLWSSWFISPAEARPTLTEPSSCQKDRHSWSPAPCLDVERREEANEDTERSKFPCKACQSRGVACDLQRPRCAHCLDEQLLCFYVAPLPPLRATRRSKRPHSTPSAAVLRAREIDISG
ncbi:hypothetical protein BDV26DRAFT_255850 [Aspergillus bertholletiae]|uniref:Zn(2)-C6 fungal-type domain-containing protein n=1 Tax=Aspergillus bertholletiae TaxID=1226010 RepID=A0A5N7BH99_9EURO|nr:hypothetical protein BDV26DRAFT_255850 [Aspergillus bertholletiae]